MKLFSLLAALTVAASPAYAGLRWCPIDQAWYDTDTGYITDDGPSPSRSSYSSSSYSSGVSDIEFDYQGYNDYLGY